ncbi:hypothetical protein [Pseudogemmobacter faecipullorum]|nr:hypothetical protein [Pseudogemmobacter faecipullorum]
MSFADNSQGALPAPRGRNLSRGLGLAAFLILIFLLIPLFIVSLR